MFTSLRLIGDKNYGACSVESCLLFVSAKDREVLYLTSIMSHPSTTSA